MKFQSLLVSLLALILSSTALSQTTGINLEGYDYPFPERRFQLDETSLEMTYMLVEPSAEPTGRTAVLLHGKNFNGAYWENTARLLASEGFRVLIPDQIGFGKSSKPANYSYTFPQLVTNTQALLEELKVEKVTVIGHSMGGMQAMHWALLAPEDMEQLILVNPIGLEDWIAKGVPYQGLQAWYAKELKTTAESIASYQKASYYDGKWNEKYARWADLLAAPLSSPDYPQLARVQALTTAMILSQPVAHRFEQIRVPTTLILGLRDRTALGKDLVSPAIARDLGRYDLLGKEVQAKIPNSRLIPLEGLGHLPQVEDFPRYEKALRQAL